MVTSEGSTSLLFCVCSPLLISLPHTWSHLLSLILCHPCAVCVPCVVSLSEHSLTPSTAHACSGLSLEHYTQPTALVCVLPTARRLLVFPLLSLFLPILMVFACLAACCFEPLPLPTTAHCTATTAVHRAMTVGGLLKFFSLFLIFLLTSVDEVVSLTLWLSSNTQPVTQDLTQRTHL